MGNEQVRSCVEEVFMSFDYDAQTNKSRNSPNNGSRRPQVVCDAFCKCDFKDSKPTKTPIYGNFVDIPSPSANTDVESNFFGDDENEDLEDEASRRFSVRHEEIRRNSFNIDENERPMSFPDTHDRIRRTSLSLSQSNNYLLSSPREIHRRHSSGNITNSKARTPFSSEHERIRRNSFNIDSDSDDVSDVRSFRSQHEGIRRHSCTLVDMDAVVTFQRHCRRRSEPPLFLKVPQHLSNLRRNSSSCSSSDSITALQDERRLSWSELHQSIDSNINQKILSPTRSYTSKSKSNTSGSEADTSSVLTDTPSDMSPRSNSILPSQRKIQPVSKATETRQPSSRTEDQSHKANSTLRYKKAHRDSKRRRQNSSPFVDVPFIERDEEEELVEEYEDIVQPCVETVSLAYLVDSEVSAKDDDSELSDFSTVNSKSSSGLFHPVQPIEQHETARRKISCSAMTCSGATKLCCKPKFLDFTPLNEPVADYCKTLVNIQFQGQLSSFSLERSRLYGSKLSVASLGEASDGMTLAAILRGMDEFLRSFSGGNVTGEEEEFLFYTRGLLEMRDPSRGKKHVFVKSFLADAKNFVKIYNERGGVSEELRHDEYWGTRQQLLAGKVIADFVDTEHGPMDPVFGVLLSPVAGRVGPGDSGVVHSLLFDDDGPLAYHSAVHDAFGYLLTTHKLGPGYDYTGSWTLLEASQCLSGQLGGLRFWREALKILKDQQPTVIL